MGVYLDKVYHYNQSVNGIFQFLEGDQNTLSLLRALLSQVIREPSSRFLTTQRIFVELLLVTVCSFPPWTVFPGLWPLGDFSALPWYPRGTGAPSQAWSHPLHVEFLMGRPGSKEAVQMMCILKSIRLLSALRTLSLLQLIVKWEIK